MAKIRTRTRTSTTTIELMTATLAPSPDSQLMSSLLSRARCVTEQV
uniref:Uncharacterized protein n=1 Tax=Anguilla anguilla TaxID=7936 RepID=A0A0E9XX72_ANGAN